NKRRGCPPKKISPRDQKLILRKFKVTPTLTARAALKEVQQELGKNASPSTIRRILDNDASSTNKALKKPFISKKNIRKRLEWCRR
ncbi:unnamed protein product, partial [Allacma fusca]